MTVKLSVITDNLTEPASFEQHYGEHKQLATTWPNLQRRSWGSRMRVPIRSGKARVKP